MKHLLRIMVLLSALTLVGTLWFYWVEGWNLLDSLYMTIITLTTVGFREVHELAPVSQVFLIVFLIVGLGVFLFGVVQLGEMVVRDELRDWLGRRRMDSALKSLKEHFIVCGFGRMGRTICQHLANRGLPFVAIDRAEGVLADCEQHGWLWLHGDATDDRTLIEAGIERARGLAVVLSSDADNLYVVISARLLAKNLQIISRATDEHGVQKMQRAGANRVVSLFATGAAKMAQLLINPNVEDFFEIFTADGSPLDLAEIHVPESSPYAGRALTHTDFRQRGIIIVGIRRPGGEVLLPPPSSTVIQPNDQLIALGKAEAISQLLINA